MDIPGWELLQAHLLRFSKLTSDELQLLQPKLQTLHLRKGESFAEAGKQARLLGFILEGSMRHYYTYDGIEHTTYFYFENNLVADYIGCITGKPSLLTIEALSPCTLLVFDYQDLQQLFARSHNWERFGRVLAEYIAAGLEERMVTLLTLSPEERYRYLLESGRDKILQRIPQHYIASYLGITPVSLSRIRNRVTRKQ